MIHAWGITDKGAVRTQNQDGFYLDVPSEHLAVGVVCDGMGGAKAGNIASLIAVETFVDALQGMQPDGDGEAGPAAVLSRAAETANTAVYHRAVTDPDCRGMGTTMVLVTIVGHYAYVANVGDSRLYLIDENKISQITKDHSLVEEMVRMGEISRDDARNHPDKNIITRALGAGRDVDVDFFDVRLTPGDILLLCSDGLSNMVPDEDIRQVILTSETLEEAGRRLVSMANDNGGRDNIAVVLVEPETKEVEVC